MNNTIDTVASIDMGTNTFHILIIKKPSKSTDQYEVIHKERVFVTIGKNGINDGIIIEEAQKRMYDALAHFRNLLKKFEVPRANTFVTATSAIRSAHNKVAILDKIREKYDLEVNVISGKMEALYIYHGVKTVISLDEEKCLIMDIGGGSVEFVIGNKQKVFWKESFEVGAQRLYDKYMTQEPIAPNDVDDLTIYATKMLASLFEAIKTQQPTYMIGSSGTFDTLSKVNEERANKATEEIRSFTTQDFESIYEDFIIKNKKERLEMPGMSPFRVDMIVVASCLLHIVLKKSNIKNIIRSPYSLKEGVISYHLFASK